MFYYIYIPIELPIIQFCSNNLEVILLRQVIANNFESTKARWWLKKPILATLGREGFITKRCG